MDILQCYVHEIASFPIHDIVVQYYLAALLFFGDCDGTLVVFSSPVGVSKANEAFSYEVNLTYFLFFLTNYLVILVVTSEKTGHEPKRNLIDELTICHKLRFEEALVLIKNVREQIVPCYLLFNIYLDLFEHAIWVFETCKSIICPEMVHVYFDLVDERLAEWSLIGKSGKPNDPLRKVIGSVGGTHLGFLALDDLYKVSHNEGKESDTAKHNNYRDNSLKAADSIHISITNSWKGGQSKVTDHNQLLTIWVLWILFKSKCLEESIADVKIFLWIHVFWDENENACNEIRDTDGNDNEPKNVITVENLVLLDDSFVITLFTLHLLE